MYEFLLRRLGPKGAQVVLAFIYVLMILAVFYCVLEPEAQFNYLNL
jgi:hypothetical protein